MVNNLRRKKKKKRDFDDINIVRLMDIYQS